MADRRDHGTSASGAHGGFTLIEVVVALTILAGAIVFLTRAFLPLLHITGQGGNITVASALAVRELETIRSAVEASVHSSERAARFDALASRGPIPLPPPHQNYSYEVLVDRVDLIPASAAPPWLHELPRHADSLRWVAVRVFFATRPLAQITSSLVRDMCRRPAPCE